MAQGVKTDHIQQEEVLGLWKQHRSRLADGMKRGEIYQEIALRTRLHIATVADIIRRNTPTVNLAQSYLKAKAMRLAYRIVKKATVAEAMDVLSRPNIGVLAPAKQATGGNGGFFLSVQAESLGGVKVGMAVLDSPPQNLRGGIDAIDAGSGSGDDFEEYQGDGGEWPPPEAGRGREHEDGGRPSLQDTLIAARAKLQAFREAGGDGGDGGHPQDQGLQESDAHPEEEEMREQV